MNDHHHQLTGLDTAVSGGATIQHLTNAYGNLNRVASASASGSYGSQSYTYDGVGNRLTRVLGSTTETYAYSTTANQITTIISGGNTRSFSYAASGQVSQDVRDATHTYTFAANDNGRDASAALNGATAGAYLYNAFEQRVQKTVGSAVTQFVFDRFGHLLAEANGSGGAQKEYIWLDDVPVAVVDDSGAAPVLYFIHTDQPGAPQKITDASATVVWDGVFDPFGNAQFVSGAGIWNSSTWNGFTWGADLSLTNLRFPGQYADTETALNQNWFRDYDPTIGRYVQSDPIGVRGGNNAYAYAGANPLRFADPWAFCSDECNRAMGRLRRKAELLVKELRKYDPITDAMGGFPMRFGSGVTRPWGHFDEINDLRRGIRNDLKYYANNCICRDQGDADTNDCAPYPRWIDELANRPVPEPVAPRPVQMQPMSPTQGVFSAGLSALLIATLLLAF